MEKLLLLELLSLLILQQVVASKPSKVESLPGLHGPLPFHLETGYIGVGKNEEIQLFYYFLPSESDPTTDPLLIWLAGGPGCSSLVAISDEIGPLRFAEEEYSGSLPRLVLNPHSWTKIASIIFLDQPVNTGFSYATTSAANKYTDVQACEYVYEFLQQWLVDHPKFISNPFYVAGNSYSGITIPIISQLISDGNAGGRTPWINLQGYLIGNPLTFLQEANYRIPFAYGMGLISYELYKSLEKNCKGEYTDIDPKNIGCANDFRIFNQMVSNINAEHILRPNCRTEEDDLQLFGERRTLLDDKLISVQPCTVNVRKLMQYWANDLQVQEALRVRKAYIYIYICVYIHICGTIGNWKRCRRSIADGSDHNYRITVNNVVPYHANLSIKGYRSLIYSGDHDLIAPSRSTQAWIKSLNYFIVDDWRPWNINDQVAGYTRSYSNKMTFATVKGAGHTACTSKPEECFLIFKRWINHDPL